jgi:hypothetical protein
MATNITTIDEKELQKMLDRAVQNMTPWGALHLVEEISKRTQIRQTKWLIATSAISSLTAKQRQ